MQEQRLKVSSCREAYSLLVQGNPLSTRTALFITQLTYKSTSVPDPKRSQDKVLIPMQYRYVVLTIIVVDRFMYNKLMLV